MHTLTTMAVMAILAHALSASAQSTVLLPLLAFDQEDINASILGSSADATTYSLACATPTAETCGIPTSFTVTAGPSTVQYDLFLSPDADGTGADQVGTGTGSIGYACKLTGTTVADCTVSQSQSFGNLSTSGVDSTVLSGTDVLGLVSVTVLNAGATLTPASNSASTTSSASGSSTNAASSTGSSAASSSSTDGTTGAGSQVQANLLISLLAAAAVAAWM